MIGRKGKESWRSKGEEVIVEGRGKNCGKNKGRVGMKRRHLLL